MMIIFWHRVIDFQKMNGLFCLNHHIQDKMCDVTPVTENRRRTESGKLGSVLSGRPETAKLSYFYFTYHFIEWRRSLFTLRLKEFKFDKVQKLVTDERNNSRTWIG